MNSGVDLGSSIEQIGGTISSVERSASFYNGIAGGGHTVDQYTRNKFFDTNAYESGISTIYAQTKYRIQSRSTDTSSAKVANIIDKCKAKANVNTKIFKE